MGIFDAEYVDTWLVEASEAVRTEALSLSFCFKSGLCQGSLGDFPAMFQVCSRDTPGIF